MSNNFKTKKNCGFEVIQNKIWLDNNVRHGFYGKAFSLSKETIDQSSKLLKEKFKVDNFIVPFLNHGNEFVEFDTDDSLKAFNRYENECDAVIIRKSASTKNSFFGILTADCLPILINTQEAYALIHSGWQGLTNGIIERVITRLIELNKAEAYFELLIGPSISVFEYEVKEDVLSQIPANSLKYIKTENNKTFLNLAATAENQINSLLRNLSFNLEVSKVCTAKTPLFNSYRADKTLFDRNLSYIIA